MTSPLLHNFIFKIKNNVLDLQMESKRCMLCYEKSMAMITTKCTHRFCYWCLLMIRSHHHPVPLTSTSLKCPFCGRMCDEFKLICNSKKHNIKLIVL